LALKKIEWDNDLVELAFTLSNGESCTSGLEEVNHTYSFDPNKKITKVDVIITKSETSIIRINFYSGQERLVKVGENDDHYVNNCGGRL
jgi:hypothetical protein